MKVIILHGWGHKKEYWKSIVQMLGKDVLAIDLPGFGSEPTPIGSWGVVEYAEWVKGRISGYKDVVLLGHSFGGRIAASLASNRPQNVKGLILTGAPCLYRPSFSVRTRILLAKLFKNLIHEDFKSFFLSDDLVSSGKMSKVFRKVVAYDQEDELRKIAIPTLLIWGERDASVPTSIAKEMSNMIEKSELVIIENTGHNLFLENPNLFYGSIKKFISNL